MIRFNEFLQQETAILVEGDAHLKTHLSHIEDLAIEQGKQGFSNFIAHIDEINKKVKGFETNQEMNAKIDGSPMILFGIDPRQQFKGQFFISLKSGLSQTPKIMHTEAEVNEFYGDVPALRDKLKNLLKYLKPAYDNSGKIYQGDVLFSLPADKRKVKIGEEDFIVFKPNVIVYAVPIDSKSVLSNRIQKSQVGVIVHEAFKGTPQGEQAIALTSAGRNVTGLVKHSINSEAFIESSNFSQVSVNVPDQTIRKVNAETSKATLHVNNISDDFDQQYLSSPVLSLLKIFLNKQVDLAPRGIFGSASRGDEFVVDTFISEFRDFVAARYRKEADTKKTPAGKVSVENRLNQILSFLETNKDDFNNLIIATYHMTAAKYNLLNMLSTLESKVGKTFIQNADGSFTPTKDEGVVLFVGTNHVKIVDRLEFTKINRASGGKNRADIIS